MVDSPMAQHIPIMHEAPIAIQKPAIDSIKLATAKAVNDIRLKN